MASFSSIKGKLKKRKLPSFNSSFIPYMLWRSKKKRSLTVLGLRKQKFSHFFRYRKHLFAYIIMKVMRLANQEVDI